MKKNESIFIDKIYEEIKNDFKNCLNENDYATNADGCGHRGESIQDALRQMMEGSVKKEDCYKITELVKSNVNSYLEIGSFLGVGFRILNEIFKPKISVSVDPNKPHRIFLNPRNTFNCLNQKFLNSTLTIDSFWSNGKNSINSSYFFNSNIKFDLIFIDGDHHYDSVKNNFFQCIDILSNKGTILLHDVYTWGGVAKFADEIKQDERFEVVFSERKNSIDGFCAVTII